MPPRQEKPKRPPKPKPAALDPSQPLVRVEHEMFAMHYATGLHTLTQAWELAKLPKGKSTSSQASRLLKRPEMAARVAFFKAVAARSKGIAPEDVVDGLLAVARSQAAPAAARVSAWTALGKTLGMFTDKVEIGLPKPLHEMTDDELQAVAAAQGATKNRG